MIARLLLNTAVIGSGYAFMAMAFNLMYAVSPFFNMTLGAVSVLAGYIVYLCLQMNLPIVLAWLMGVGTAVAFSCFLEGCIYTPMRSKGASSMILMVASLGIYIIFESVIRLSFGPQYQLLENISSQKMLNIFSLNLPLAQALMIVISLIIFIILQLLLKYTFLGKSIRAVHNSRTLAEIIGLNIRMIIFTVSAICGFILGLYGILTGYDTGLVPTLGFNLLFKGMIGAIIGGLATLSGAYWGALFLALAENIGVMFFASEWRDLIAFVVFIAFLFFKPQGIFQKKTE